jgi:fructokinase
LSADGDRSFSFYRNPGADTRLREDEVDYGLIDEACIFHFGSLSMTDEPSRTATLKAAAHARKSGRIISYDPNWRPPLWRSDAEAKAGMEAALQFADILKISDTELAFLTGTTDLDAGSKMLMERGIKLVLVTLGSKGSYFRHPGGTGHLFTYDTRVIDTTGAGDAFLGSMLYQVSRRPAALEDIETGEISRMVDFSNAVGALCASGKGGMPSMPSMDNVLMCMKNIPKLIR